MSFRNNYKVALCLITALMLLSGCTGTQINDAQYAFNSEQKIYKQELPTPNDELDSRQQDSQVSGYAGTTEHAADISETTTTEKTTQNTTRETVMPTLAMEAIPEYDGVHAYILLNTEPVFTQEQISSGHFIKLSEMDAYGRCGAAVMKATKECLPTEERGEIGHIRPAGWHTIKFNDDERYRGLIDGNYLYNRSHLLMYALSGLNDDARNLITATRYCNVEGMLPNESRYLEYVQSGGQLLYRVTPVYANETDLLCRGVLLEAYSCNDAAIRECIFCFNVQPGVIINYTDGTAVLGSDAETIAMKNRGEADSLSTPEDNSSEESTKNAQKESQTYCVNTNTRKFHKQDCASIKKMKEDNKLEYMGTAEELRAQGYEPCKNCNP